MRIIPPMLRRRHFRVNLLANAIAVSRLVFVMAYGMQMPGMFMNKVRMSGVFYPSQMDFPMNREALASKAMPDDPMLKGTVMQAPVVMKRPMRNGMMRARLRVSRYAFGRLYARRSGRF